MNIHSLWRLIFKTFRVWRFNLFLREIKPQRSEVLLDVGGYPQTWLPHEPCVGEVHLLNVHDITLPSEEESKGHRFVKHLGDGRKLPFADKQFDVVFSNSVIEHVGDLEKQSAFAAEVRRVGGRLWVQTPAYEFFIEPHLLTPFFHWFSRATQRRIARQWTVWGWISRPTQAEAEAMVDDIRLMTYAEFSAMFPDCEIRRERFCWVFTKSYIALSK
jgi:SAM-dependent methyltransferase